MSPKANTALSAARSDGKVRVNSSYTKPSAYISAKYLKAGQEITGLFQGSYTYGEGKKASTNHNLTLSQPVTVTINEGTSDEPNLVSKSLKAGENVVLNGTGGLNKTMRSIVKGADITVQYLGKKAIEKGEFKGTKAHQFDVFAAPTAIAAAAPTAETSEAAADETDSDEIPF